MCICGRDGNIIAGSYRSKIGSRIKSAISGISHGVVDFVIGSFHDLQTSGIYIGSEELSLHERTQMIEAIEYSQANQMGKVEGWMMDLLSVDESDTVYQYFRSKTSQSLGIASLVVGGYGAIKRLIGFNKLARMPRQVAGLFRKHASLGTRC